MTHPMLEKVARNIAAARNNTDGDCAWQDELPAARAAVQALMEPDEGMVDIGNDLLDYGERGSEEIFRAMLRVMLDVV